MTNWAMMSMRSHCSDSRNTWVTSSSLRVINWFLVASVHDRELREWIWNLDSTEDSKGQIVLEK